MYKKVMEENEKVKALVAAHVGGFVTLLGAVMASEADEEEE